MSLLSVDITAYWTAFSNSFLHTLLCKQFVSLLTENSKPRHSQLSLMPLNVSQSNAEQFERSKQGNHKKE
jgi:hypothetical protein